MISEHYTKGYNNKKSILVFGNKPEDITGYADAISSDELYVPHHILEKDYTMKELQQMNRYDNVPASELVWLPQSFHNGNREIHKGLRESKPNHIGKWTRSEKTRQKLFYSKYERKVEFENKQREQRLMKIRFELTFNRTDISRQRKYKLCESIIKRVNRNIKLEEFEKLLKRQSELKIVGGIIWFKYEEKLQKLIEVL